MKNSTFLIFALCFWVVSLKGQTALDKQEGTLSYVTSQSIYVKFPSTSLISVGDTLFTIQESKKIPVLLVTALSSISCVCIPIGTISLAVNDKIFAFPKSEINVGSNETISKSTQSKTILNNDSILHKIELTKQLEQQINGRFSLSTYSNFSNKSDNSHRLRYTLSLDAHNIGNSKLSSETYISFSHKVNEWSEIENNIFNGLKIYSLAINYEFNKNNSLWLGRKINPRISNVGAIDGIQYENKFKSFSSGIFAGSRPDYFDYSYNVSLFQFGGYIGHDYTTQIGMIQSSLAFVEQQNNGNTDRRFAYLQHSNSLVKNLYFFGSLEFDLYNKVLNSQDSTYSTENLPKLSNLFASIRYRVIKQVSLSLSYSNRENVVYYETYKNILDKLLDPAKMQGYMFQVNYSPVNTISMGANTGYRFSKKDPSPSKNLYSYVTYNNVPWLQGSTTVSITLLETSYLSGKIYSIGISRDLVPGKLYGGVNYRFVDYIFVSNETPLAQHMAEMNLSWRILKKLSCSLNCEGTFEKETNYQSIYFNITQRF